MLERYYALVLSKPEFGDIARRTMENPKRIQREAARAVSTTGIGTKAQQALKAQYEAGKQENKELPREEKRAQDEQNFCFDKKRRKPDTEGISPRCRLEEELQAALLLRQSVEGRVAKVVQYRCR